MLTAITEVHQEEPRMNTKTFQSLQSTTPALEAKKKTQQMNKSTDLWSAYLQQFKQYPLPLIPLPLKTASQLCQFPQPLLPRYNPIPLLKEQACQEEDHLEEAEEGCQEEEEGCQEEEEVHQEEEEEEAMLTNQLLTQMENLWACYQQYLKEIAWKLRASSKNFPPTS